MLTIVCRALGHRCRVVQEFTPVTRRVKCERCGGDWAMNDLSKTMLPWSPAAERIGRQFGFEIAEPVDQDDPCWKPLSESEMFLAARWPGALALVLAVSAEEAVSAAGFGIGARFIASLSISCATMQLLMPFVRRSAYRRRCNSLEA